MRKSRNARTGGQKSVRWTVAIGNNARARALKLPRPAALELDFPEISPVFSIFAPMAREQAFDVAEMAIATFLQAIAYGKPLTLLPVVMAARYQEAALLCLRDSAIAGPADLRGRRVGVRAYSQTTGLWLRGVLADDFGVRAEDVRWTTFEDAHVSEYRDPVFTTRAGAGKELMAMLKARELDAIVVGSDPLVDPELRAVFADPAAAGRAFQARRGFMPINHVLVARRDVAREHPAELAALARQFADLGVESYRAGRPAMTPALAMAARLAAVQGLTPKALTLDEIWAHSPNLDTASTAA